MNDYKKELIETHIKRAVWYSYYVDCFIRLLIDISEGDYNNISKFDTVMLLGLLAKYSKRLNKNVEKMEHDWEFYR